MNQTTKQAMNWMYRFEETVIAARPDFAGKIEWATAEHFYNIGKSVTDAAAQYCVNRAEVMHEQRLRGQLHALHGEPAHYGCHLGMRSTLERDKAEYYEGHSEVSFYLTCGDYDHDDEPWDTDGDTSKWNENGEASEAANDRYATRTFRGDELDGGLAREVSNSHPSPAGKVVS